MFRERYQAYEINDDRIIMTKVDGSLSAMALYLREGSKQSIIILYSSDGELFLVALSDMFLYCSNQNFLNQELIPYLTDTNGACI